MDEDKWMTFIHSYWSMIAYWEMIKGYRKHELPGAFWSLNALACRNQFLMQIAHTVKLCAIVTKAYDIGSDALATFNQIQALFAKGDANKRSVLKFEDCGVLVFRDKVLAHPLNEQQKLLGKPEFEISLKWDTVEQTLIKIKEFADQVEQHNIRKGSLDFSTYKDEVGGPDIGFMTVTWALEEAEKHDKLKLAVRLKGGKATVSCSYQKDSELVVEE